MSLPLAGFFAFEHISPADRFVAKNGTPQRGRDTPTLLPGPQPKSQADDRPTPTRYGTGSSNPKLPRISATQISSASASTVVTRPAGAPEKAGSSRCRTADCAKHSEAGEQSNLQHAQQVARQVEHLAAAE